MNNNPLKVYDWSGVNTAGEVVNGVVEATHLVVAKNQLLLQGVTHLKIRPQQPLPWYCFQKKIHAKDITQITSQLNLLIQTGIPLLQSLQIVLKSVKHPSLKRLLWQISFHLERGCSFAESLRQFPIYFNQLFCHLIEIGEKSGRLEMMLEQIIAQRESHEKMQQQLLRAFTYPGFVLAFSFLIITGLLMGIVPKFQQLFTSFGAELPWMTHFIIQLSQWIRTNGFWCIGIGLFGVIGLVGAKHHVKMIPFENILLKLPILGTIIQKKCWVQFARTLAITYAAGIPVMDAITFIATMPNYTKFQQAFIKLRESIVMGQSLYGAIESTHIFPSKMTQMLAIGEESGHLEQMLHHIANIYETEVTQHVEQLGYLLEPMIMVIVGFLVGAVIIGMYLPIFKMGSLL